MSGGGKVVFDCNTFLQAMAAPKQIGGREQLDGDGIYLARHHRPRRLPGLAVTQAQQPLA